MTDYAHLPDKLKWWRSSYFKALQSILKIRPKFITDVEITNENAQQRLWISTHAGILEMKLPSPDKIASEGSLKK